MKFQESFTSPCSYQQIFTVNDGLRMKQKTLKLVAMDKFFRHAVMRVESATGCILILTKIYRTDQLADAVFHFPVIEQPLVFHHVGQRP